MKHDTAYIRAAYEKYRGAKSLTDEEMKALRDHFRALDKHLLPLKDMHIVHRAVAQDLSALEGYVQARQQDKRRGHLRSV